MPATTKHGHVDCSDADRMQTLYRATGRAALSKTEQLVGRRDIAEEIVQEVFLRLWNAALQFDTEKQAFLWIYKACHNAGIDYLRSAGVRRAASAAPEDLDPASFVAQ